MNALPVQRCERRVNPSTQDLLAGLGAERGASLAPKRADDEKIELQLGAEARQRGERAIRLLFPLVPLRLDRNLVRQ